MLATSRFYSGSRIINSIDKMLSKFSKSDIKQKLNQLLASEEGIIILLGGALVISDFDDIDEALEEALKTFNSNRNYFLELIKKTASLQKNKSSSPE
jgi:hypothetical protein